VRERVDAANRRIATGKLNDWLVDVQKRRQAPTTGTGRAPRLYYMTQSGVNPPEFTLFVNAPDRLSQAYRRFLWSRFIDHFGFAGTPVRFRMRKSQ
jgi:GTP-binding protein